MLDELLYFLSLFETGSYSKTAINLNVVQSTVTRKVSSLENRLGITLVVRNTRHVEFTDAGKQLYEKIHGNVNELIESVHAVREQEVQEIQGDVTIALPHLCSEIILPKLGEYLRHHPAVTVKLFFQNWHVNLVKDIYDIALLAYVPSQQSLKIKQLAKMRFKLFCTQKYIDKYGLPKTIDDLYNKHIIADTIKVDEKDLKDSTFVNEKTGEQIVIKNPCRIHISTTLYGTKVIFSNEVIAGIWDKLLTESGDFKNLVPVLPKYYFDEIPIYLVRQPNKMSSVIESFIEFLERCFKPHFST